MNTDNTSQLQVFLDRLRRGEPTARHELIERAYVRLRRLTATLFRTFPTLQVRHDLDSVFNDTWLRLVQALDKVQPPTVEDFFRLAAHKIHQVLLDLLERQRRLDRVGGEGSPKTPLDKSDDTHDPA